MKCFFIAFIPSEFGIFVRKDFTSSDTNYDINYLVQFTYEVTCISNMCWDMFDKRLKLVIYIF